MTTENQSFDARAFWGRIEGVYDPAVLRPLHSEFIAATTGRAMTEDEFAVDVYLKAQLK